MKKVLLALSLLALIGTASAHEGFRYRSGCCYRGPGMGWVAPAIIGGVVGYELSRPSTVYVEPAPVYIPPPVVYTQSQPVVQAPPPGMHWQEMIDPQSGIRKIVAVPN